MTEKIPLSEYCPLQETEVGEATKLELRDRAVELFYGELVEPHEVADRLQEEFGVVPETADAAVECLGKIMRNYCTTCVLSTMTDGSYLRPRT